VFAHVFLGHGPVALPDHVDNMRVLQDLRQGAPRRQVEAARSLAASPHQEKRQARPIALGQGPLHQVRQLAPGVFPVLRRMEQFGPDRIAGNDRFALWGESAEVRRSICKADGHALRKPAEPADRGARNDIRQVNQHRHTALPARCHDRRTHITTRRQADVRPELG